MLHGALQARRGGRRRGRRRRAARRPGRARAERDHRRDPVGRQRGPRPAAVDRPPPRDARRPPAGRAHPRARPPGRARRAARRASPRPAATSSTSPTCARASTCTCARPPSSSCSRRAGASTPTACCGDARRAATPRSRSNTAVCATRVGDRLSRTPGEAVEHEDKTRSIVIWTAVAIVGAVAWGVIALVRGEQISAAWLIFAAVASYAIAYRFYARFIAQQGAGGRSRTARRPPSGSTTASTTSRPTGACCSATTSPRSPAPARSSARSSPRRWATCPARSGSSSASSSPAPCRTWSILFFSMRRDGKSLGQMARDEIGPVGGAAALIAVFAIMIILLAVLALVVVNALAQSPWGTFSLAMTIPIALFMGFYLRVMRPGRVLETTAIGVDAAARRDRAGRRGRRLEPRRRVHALARDARASASSPTASSPRCCRCGCCSRRATTSRRS